jgi:phenylpropionate dioxygenase-like ring-hydroxylating dioxygenase large terminal subunit
MATQLKSVRVTPDPLDGMSLPGWLYHDAEFFAAEQRAFLRAAPQVVCHESEIALAGEWRSLDYLGESVIAIRGDDGVVRAFANVCRHRGSRLVDGPGGCAKVLTCPYHAWSYARDGRLVGVPHRAEYPGLEPGKLGLVPVELECWHGFLFVTLEPGAPSVAEMMAEFEDEVAPYRLEDDRRQLFRRAAHSGRPSRPDAVVRTQLSHFRAPACRPDGRRAVRAAVGQPVRARLPEVSARG